MRVDVGSETAPVLIMLHADALTEDSAHILSKPDIGDFEMDLGITVVISTNIVGIGQNAWIYSFSENRRGLDFTSHSHFWDISAEYSIKRTELLAVLGHHAGALW